MGPNAMNMRMTAAGTSAARPASTQSGEPASPGAILSRSQAVKSMLGSRSHRSISPRTTSSDPMSAMMSAIIIPLARMWKTLMAVKQGLFTLTR